VPPSTDEPNPCRCRTRQLLISRLAGQMAASTGAGPVAQLVEKMPLGHHLSHLTGNRAVS
jgi:hypothetical protein